MSITLKPLDTYEAKLHVTWIESLAPEATIEAEAKKELLAAGFVAIQVWEKDGAHWAIGVWNGPLTTLAELPERIDRVWDLGPR